MNPHNPLMKGVVATGCYFENAGHIPRIKPKESERVQLVEELFELPSSYNTLAWSAFYGLRNHVIQNIPTDKLEKVTSLTSVTGAANRGIRQMARYASFLPLMYEQQRHAFPDMPQSLEDQLKDLSDIATRSLGPIAACAAQPIPISGVVEYNLQLRKSYPHNPAWAIKEANYTYLLVVDQGRIGVMTRFAVESQIEAVRGSYKRDHKGREAKGPGCLALRLSTNGIEPVLLTVWRAMVANATNDPKLFAQSIQQARKVRERNGL